jgi:hypothetical protein
MFEEFRTESGDFAFGEGDFDEGAFDEGPEEGAEQDVYAFKESAPRKQYFLGMKPAQRFVIAVMILLMTCILSSFLLLVTERIAPPFLS